MKNNLNVNKSSFKSQYYISRSLAVIVILAAFFVSCDQPEGLDPEVITFSPFIFGGFDDIATAGAAFGYAVDSTHDLILAVAFKFTLPFYSGEFKPVSNVENLAQDYSWGFAPSEMMDDTAQYPLLAHAVTNGIGIRGMSTKSNVMTAILLRGNYTDSIPQQVYIASSGLTVLTREDGPRDIFITNSLTFTEVSKSGTDAKEIHGASPVQLVAVEFSWNW